MPGRLKLRCKQSMTTVDSHQQSLKPTQKKLISEVREAEIPRHKGEFQRRTQTKVRLSTVTHFVTDTVFVVTLLVEGNPYDSTIITQHGV